MGDVVCSEGREHAAIWARRVWEEAAAINRDHVCILNDDVILRPGFHEMLESMVHHVPDEPLSLHCTNPNAIPLAAEGHKWARAYHYTGPAVVLPPGAARSLCDFTYSLPWSFLSRVNEDNLANLWAWDRQRPFWYALPAPVTHDVSVPSTLGYDNHPNRVPVVLGPPEYDWSYDEEPPFIELAWNTTAHLDNMRRVLRSGRHLCTVCIAREGVVGMHRDGPVLCHPCLSQFYGAALRGTQGNQT